MPNKASSRAFKTAWFGKAAKKARIGDQALRASILEVIQGQADDLGGGVFMKRLNDNMDRSIVLSKVGRHWVFAYLFARRTAPISTPTSWLLSRSSRRPTVA